MVDIRTSLFLLLSFNCSEWLGGIPRFQDQIKMVQVDANSNKISKGHLSKDRRAMRSKKRDLGPPPCMAKRLPMCCVKKIITAPVGRELKE